MKVEEQISAVWPGQSYPRGATWDGAGVNFSLFSANATSVELCLFDPTGRHEIQRIELRERTDESWHAYLPEARPGLLYGFRVHGPYDPERGQRFNAHKLLIEPYAKHLQGPLRLERCALRLSRRSRPRRPVLRSPRQRARHAQVPRGGSGVHLG